MDMSGKVDQSKYVETNTGGGDYDSVQQPQQQPSVASSGLPSASSAAASSSSPCSSSTAVATALATEIIGTLSEQQAGKMDEKSPSAFLKKLMADGNVNKCNGNKNSTYDNIEPVVPPIDDGNDDQQEDEALAPTVSPSSVNYTTTTRESCPVLVVEVAAISDQESALLSLQQQRHHAEIKSKRVSNEDNATVAAAIVSISSPSEITVKADDEKSPAEQKVVNDADDAVPAENEMKSPNAATETIISKENRAENSLQAVIKPDDDKTQKNPTEKAAVGPSSATATQSSTSSGNSSNRDNSSKGGGATSSLLTTAMPLDSWHHVASYLTLSEWSSFGKTCSAAHCIHKEIIRRVRLHGFKCATEVVTAWKLHQQHADAKELVALYIRSGVPIYPSSLGHSYHSLVWRMQVESKEMMKSSLQILQNSNSNANINAQGTATSSRPEANEQPAAAAANNVDGQSPSQRPSSSSSSSSSSFAAAAERASSDAVISNATNLIPISATATTEGPLPRVVDPFFTDRVDFRAALGYSPRSVTYLEEKCLYWMDYDATAAAAQFSDASSSAATTFGNNNSSTPTRRGDLRTAVSLTVIPPAAVAEYRAMIFGENAETTTITTQRRNNNRHHHHATINNATARMHQPSPSQSRQSSQPSSLSSPVRGHARMPLKIHQHLLNQHRIGMYCVDDQDGTMVTPPINLSVDFYHPQQQQQRPSYAAAEKMEGDDVDNAGAGDLTVFPEIGRPREEQQQQPGLARDNVENDVDHHLALAPDDDNGDDQHPEDITDVPSSAEPQPPPSPFRLSTIANYCDLDSYTAASENNNKKTTDATSQNNNGSRELKRHLRSRFATYQRRLNTFLSHSDSRGFEECMLDFWDEFFPHTANIQYYDLHTPVPRISCLPKFLTKPCPKSIGIVQCEIERIKITAKGKGVSMKGRLFPTYEYRLFIRNQPHRDAQQEGVDEDAVDEPFTRRDTVLMVAKNRGRKHAEVSGVTASKKGANNYYLYMPQQADVDAHFNKVNGVVDEPSKKLNSNGASHEPVIVSDETSSVLLGRLQSNFIGTEFQIFTPSVRKQRRKHDVQQQLPRTVMSPSDDEVDYDSGVSSDNNSSRRSRFGRFLRSSNPATSCNSDASLSSLETPRTRARSEPRRASSPDLGSRPNRPNRRAIANSEHQQQQVTTTTQATTTMAEEEDGAITYTANLLGSRSRIMDVCIPKVAADGVAGKDWKKFLETCEDHDDCRMLNCFKTLQQRLENLDPQQPRLPGDLADAHARPGNVDNNNNNNAANTTTSTTGGGEDHHGLLALQNRPPWWNVELGSFVLNFGGRVSVASVKNFQLCDRADQDNIMLQFGRIQGRHSFTMDFQHPLTAVQAFSIAISSLQSKISFG
jgi:Tub family